MVRLFLIAVSLTLSTVAHAQDGRQILQGILGGVLSEVERQQQIQQQQQLQLQQQQYQQQLYQNLLPVWQRCGGGDIGACDDAAQFPLSDSDRYQLGVMRRNVVMQQVFRANWDRCFQDEDINACRSALAHPNLADSDRNNLNEKQQSIQARAQLERQRLEESLQEQRRLEIERQAAEVRRAQLERQRAEEALQEQRRRVLEQERQNAKEACLRRDEAACRRGLILASDNSERAQFMDLVEVAQSPLGLKFLKPLKDVPPSTVGAGGVALVFGLLLVLAEVRRRKSSTTVRAAAPAVPTVLPAVSLPPVREPPVTRQEPAEAPSAPPAAPPRAGPESTDNALSAALGNAGVFVTLYIVVMLLTYILPWMGSNSAVLSGVGKAAGAGMYPLFWLHLIVWGTLIALAWARGAVTGHGWLVVLPILGTVFDMVPILNWIPLVPTALNLACVISGVSMRPRLATA